MTVYIRHHKKIIEYNIKHLFRYIIYRKDVNLCYFIHKYDDITKIMYYLCGTLLKSVFYLYLYI